VGASSSTSAHDRALTRRPRPIAALTSLEDPRACADGLPRRSRRSGGVAGQGSAKLLFALEHGCALAPAIARALGGAVALPEERGFEDGERKLRPPVDPRGAVRTSSPACTAARPTARTAGWCGC
jgi:hypothetical protein